ncbi:MAG: hypothetical protein AVDCRST_MAG08-3504, partial [uncultured Acetobacteraceae bacterium]
AQEDSRPRQAVRLRPALLHRRGAGRERRAGRRGAGGAAPHGGGRWHRLRPQRPRGGLPEPRPGRGAARHHAGPEAGQERPALPHSRQGRRRLLRVALPDRRGRIGQPRAPALLLRPRLRARGRRHRRRSRGDQLPAPGV